MSIALILTRSHDRDFNETGKTISRERWHEYVDQADDLRFRSSPHVARNPASGARITVSPGDAESEWLGVIGPRPFLRYRAGTLVMRLSFDPEDERDPVRRRVAEVARDFGALITHDAGDEILDW